MCIGYDFPRFFWKYRLWWTIVVGDRCGVGLFKEIFLLNNQHLIFFFFLGVIWLFENGTFDVDSMKNC